LTQAIFMFPDVAVNTLRVNTLYVDGMLIILVSSDEMRAHVINLH